MIIDVIDVSTASRLATAMHWPDNYLAGHTPEGFPVRIKYSTIVVDCREQNTFQ